MTLHWGQVPKRYQNVSSTTCSFCERGVRQSSLYTSPRGVVLRRGGGVPQWTFAIDGDIFWSLQWVVVVSYWHLLGGGQGCHYTSPSGQDGHTTRKIMIRPQVATVQRRRNNDLGSSTFFILLCNTGFRPSPSATFFTPSVSVLICKMFTWINRQRDISAPNPCSISLKKKDILL